MTTDRTLTRVRRALRAADNFSPDELRDARQRLEMTQQELANALGLTREFVAMMESGTKGIERRTVMSVLLLELIGCDSVLF